MAYMCPDSFACNSRLQHSYYWSNGLWCCYVEPHPQHMSGFVVTLLVIFMPLFCWSSPNDLFPHLLHQYYTAVHSSLEHLNRFLCPSCPITPYTFHNSFTAALAHIFQPHMNPSKLQLYWCCHDYYLPRRADSLGIRWFTTGKDHKDLQNIR